jgi:hypothetical protein
MGNTLGCSPWVKAGAESPKASELTTKNPVFQPIITSKPDNMVEEPFLKSPEDRGLCGDCARFNWAYHLGRFADSPSRDSTFKYEDAFINEYIQSHQSGCDFDSSPDAAWGRSESTSGSPAKHLWYYIEGAPYSGGYWTDKERSQTTMTLGRSHDAGHTLYTKSGDTPYNEPDWELLAGPCKVMRSCSRLSPCHPSALANRNCSFCRLIFDSIPGQELCNKLVSRFRDRIY